MSKPLNYLLGFLIGIACLAFAYGIFLAARISWPDKPDVKAMPVFLSNVVTSIATILATNLGAVIGVSFSDPNSAFARSSNWNPLRYFSQDSPTVFQTTACYLYVLGLVAAAIVWAHKGFTDDVNQVVALIPDLTKSLLGVIIGALAIALNVPRRIVKNS